MTKDEAKLLASCLNAENRELDKLFPLQREFVPQEDLWEPLDYNQMSFQLHQIKFEEIYPSVSDLGTQAFLDKLERDVELRRQGYDPSYRRRRVKVKRKNGYNCH